MLDTQLSNLFRLPNEVYEQDDEKLQQYSWRNLLFVGFYRVVLPLSMMDRQHNILFCQAGLQEFTYLTGPCRNVLDYIGQ
jgi:hypothetical protein